MTDAPLITNNSVDALMRPVCVRHRWTLVPPPSQGGQSTGESQISERVMSPRGSYHSQRFSRRCGPGSFPDRAPLRDSVAAAPQLQ
eukprot:CAMPEP_0118958794 /NCGR_PEP_ID=MMETSP1169-20130426/62806_1 /TAXON_ID=36882 /ORGANISM="Pyramimonas obovata, Strain CCMP722" /LENGTH=85 /DNA_ID=CAMNT_0006906921 /DNA_START=565 /DNA_END=822 /DNA_ORIENTATION=-